MIKPAMPQFGALFQTRTNHLNWIQKDPAQGDTSVSNDAVRNTLTRQQDRVLLQVSDLANTPLQLLALTKSDAYMAKQNLSTPKGLATKLNAKFQLGLATDCRFTRLDVSDFDTVTAALPKDAPKPFPDMMGW